MRIYLRDSMLLLNGSLHYYYTSTTRKVQVINEIFHRQLLVDARIAMCK